jgi:hypothetical protein
MRQACTLHATKRIYQRTQAEALQYTIIPEEAITMRTIQSFFLAIALLVASTSAFGVSSARMTLVGSTGATSFVVSQRSPAVAAPKRAQSARRGDLQMGNVAKFGVFSPAVIAAKLVLGQDKLNKIRGKAIALHSEKISEFSEWVGAYHLRTKLIKKAKLNGDILGFLV